MKRTWLVIGFSCTTSALKLEKEAHAHGVSGKLIPIPRQMSATCGLAFRAEPVAEACLRELVRQHQIEVEAIAQVEL